MAIMKALLPAMFTLGFGVLALSAAAPTTPLKAIAPPRATNAATPPKQDTLAETKKKAEAGDTKAQVAFGEEFMRMQKFTMAEHWYAEAGAKGEPAALYALAELYGATRGSGTNTVKANPTNAVTLHKLAAAQGYS